VANICVYATSEAKQPIAIVSPHEANLRNVLESSRVNHDLSLRDLCANSDVRDLVLKECNAVGRKEGFKAAEILHALVLTPEEWTPESGLVTPAQKIQRGKIAQTFKDEIEVCFLPRVENYMNPADRLYPG
jgi:long-chain acyl-CoA synthetase